MPMLQRTDSIAGNAINTNVWTGTQYEFAPYNAILELGILGSATGLNATIATGPDTLCIEQNLSVVRAANQYPIYPDDFFFVDTIAVGQRIVETIRNTTVGALSHFSSLRLTPI